MQDLEATLASVRGAQRLLAAASGEQRSRALQALAQRLKSDREAILAANQVDLERADSEGLTGPLRDRLALSEAKLEGLIEGLETLVLAGDQVGQIETKTELDSGLVLRRVKAPLGVVLVIFESRPDAVIQIGGLALRTGNAALLKGGREALESNRALVGALRSALSDVGLDPNAIQGVETRDQVGTLLQADHAIDLVIPRGSTQLVRKIQETSRIPVLGHAEGLCHLVLDASADPEKALPLVVDSKCQYPAACNALETLLVHEGFVEFLGPILAALAERGVELRLDAALSKRFLGYALAQAEDWETEYSDLVLAVKRVPDLEAAIAHIHRFGSGHTECLVSEDPEAKRTFLARVDAASVFVNASTRFADGFRFGLGAEVGISTSKLHARGPVGAEGLFTTRYLLEGEGQVVASYSSGEASFTHRRQDPEAGTWPPEVGS